MVLGHEFMGIVEEVGKNVTNLKKGDRVIIPCIVGCGHCYFCNKGLTPQCEKSNEEHYGLKGEGDEVGGGVFGYSEKYGNYQGGQAELVRVPYANFGPVKIEKDFKDEQVLFLTDIFPTGWTAIERAQLKGGETVVIFGCGPVGIMAQKSAWLQGAGRVIGVDILDYRLDHAKKTARSEIINGKNEDPIEAIRHLTNGKGADVCVDAVGMEANRTIGEKISNFIHMQAGTINALNHCISSVKRGGTVSIIGVYGSNYSNFPLGKIFDKGISIHSGPVLIHKNLNLLLNMVRERKIILDDIITHTLPLSKAVEGYEMFGKKEDGCLKVILKP